MVSDVVRVYVNRYAFTDCGPAMIRTTRKITTAQARRIFSAAGFTVVKFVPNWMSFVGWGHVHEIPDPHDLIAEPTP